MTRTNIDIDDDLIDDAMRRYGLTTKREAVDFALRRLVGTPLTKGALANLRGIGWEGDLATLRGGDPWQHR